LTRILPYFELLAVLVTLAADVDGLATLDDVVDAVGVEEQAASTSAVGTNANPNSRPGCRQLPGGLNPSVHC
jgi:hypothetical protein